MEENPKLILSDPLLESTARGFDFFLPRKKYLPRQIMLIGWRGIFEEYEIY